ncbi:hypothetical protein ACROYT_G015665 [Oculina patagonica]
MNDKTPDHQGFQQVLLKGDDGDNNKNYFDDPFGKFIDKFLFQRDNDCNDEDDYVRNYGLCFIFLAILIIQMKDTAAEADEEFKWGFFSNWRGVGRNIEDDPAQEISNRCSKSVVQRMGPNINSISKVCKATTGLQQITQQFDLSIGIHKTSVQHTTRDSLKDEKELVADLIQLDHFNHVPARSHDSFPDIKKCPLRYFNVVDFYQWLDKHKRELST